MIHHQYILWLGILTTVQAASPVVRIKWGRERTIFNSSIGPLIAMLLVPVANGTMFLGTGRNWSRDLNW